MSGATTHELCPGHADKQGALTIAGVFRQRHNFCKYLIAPISFQRRAMRWLRWVVLAVLVPLVVAGATLARASTEPPREKVVEPPAISQYY
jgi:hypothetical protein